MIKKNQSVKRNSVFNFHKEADGRWYLESPEWEQEQTQLFRETHKYLDEEDGKWKSYQEKQDLSDPKDDHTKHPEWRDPRMDQRLIMDPTFEALLEKLAKGKLSVALDVLAYGWVSNTYVHYQRTSYDESGASYRLRFGNDLPERFRLTPICRWVFDGSYPEFLHGKVLGC